MFLEKTPKNISVSEIKEHILEIDNVIDVHHVHVWSLDGNNNCATMHVVTNSESHEIKEKIKEELKEHGIIHSTLEFEKEDEECHEKECTGCISLDSGHHHHHHH